jgi:hypothetical protein
VTCPFHAPEQRCGYTRRGGCPVAHQVLELVADAPTYNGRDYDDGSLIVEKRTGVAARSGQTRAESCARYTRAYRERRRELVGKAG